jgi:hypothetical protein
MENFYGICLGKEISDVTLIPGDMLAINEIDNATLIPSNMIAINEISNVSLIPNNIIAIRGITINFTNFDKIMKLIAVADCCSSSWFHFFDDVPINSIVGKKIKSIETLETIDLPLSNVQEYDRNYLISIIFEDNSKYNFVLRNSSNGYYDGWLDIKISKSIYPPK